jgi:hypothetical protein
VRGLRARAYRTCAMISLMGGLRSMESSLRKRWIAQSRSSSDATG